MENTTTNTTVNTNIDTKTRGKIRVGKYNYKTNEQPKTEGYENVLIHTSGELSPYTMKDDNYVIMENFYQHHKIWKKVTKQLQPLSQYQPNIIRWEHPEEVHMNDDGTIKPEYWSWRQKGFANSRWVRYPTGYKHHHEAVGSVIGTPNNYKIISYIEARKQIYVPKYKEIAVQTELYRKLQEKLDKGINLQINEVDGPTYTEEYPYNQVVDGSIEITAEILDNLLNNPKQAFGHGYTLAGCLLGIL